MASIAELSSEANSYAFNHQISFASWLHVCQTLLRESRVYDAEDQDLERAYILYLRFADLVLNKLRTHPDFSQNKKQYARAYNQLPMAIERSEELKKRILDRRAQQAEIDELQSQQRPQPPSIPPKSGSRALTLEEELEHFASHVDDNHPELQFDPSSLKISHPVRDSQNYSLNASPLAISVPRYPSLSSRRPDPAPTKPHPSFDLPSASASTHAASSRLPSRIPQSIASSARSEKGESLRHIFVPQTLRERFLQVAKPNTDANLETCGMLCGKLERNAFFVTDLVIPHQLSTPDTCATTNEEELFEYVDQRDLFLVGWIHTHPSQSCFMSSVDLHTHASYQLMLPESVALVCAPTSQPSWAAFRLTDPPGIPVIRACKLTGFHPHDNPDSLYKSASRPGHYQEIASSLVTKDLRLND